MKHKGTSKKPQVVFVQSHENFTHRTGMGN